MDDHQANTTGASAKLLAHAQLFRIPNLSTAMADVAMGFLFVHQRLAPGGVFACLLLASCLVYTAGMVLNDVYDLEVDSRERPERPLPSGRISPVWAKWLGYQLLLAGVVFGWLAGYAAAATWTAWRSGGVVMLLAVCVVLYDAVLKRTPVASVMMGLCRTFNVLLGMSVAPAIGGAAWRIVYFGPDQLLVAGGVGLYIVGVTWFARTEATQSSRLVLVAGTVVMMAGIATISLFPNFGHYSETTTSASLGAWRILLLVLALTIARRCLTAAYRPTPARVQTAIKQCLLSLIVLDAAVCLVTSGPMWAAGVLVLLVPALLLGRWVYST